MRLLVTGGAGYIGSIVAQRLLERGDEVTILDSLYRGHRSAIPDDAEFEQVDRLDLDETRRVLHFVALALIAESGAHVLTSLNLLDAMREAGGSSSPRPAPRGSAPPGTRCGWWPLTPRPATRSGALARGHDPRPGPGIRTIRTAISGCR